MNGFLKSSLSRHFFFVFALFILTFLLASLTESASVPWTRPWLQLWFVQFIVMKVYWFMTATFPTVHNVSTSHSLRKSNWFTVYWFPCWFVLSLGNCIATVWACQISIVTLFKRRSKKLSDALTFLLCFFCCYYSTTQNIKQNYRRWKPYSAF